MGYRAGGYGQNWGLGRQVWAELGFRADWGAGQRLRSVFRRPPSLGTPQGLMVGPLLGAGGWGLQPELSRQLGTPPPGMEQREGGSCPQGHPLSPVDSAPSTASQGSKDTLSCGQREGRAHCHLRPVGHFWDPQGPGFSWTQQGPAPSGRARRPCPGPRGPAKGKAPRWVWLMAQQWRQGSEGASLESTLSAQWGRSPPLWEGAGLSEPMHIARRRGRWGPLDRQGPLWGQRAACGDGFPSKPRSCSEQDERSRAPSGQQGALAATGWGLPALSHPGQKLTLSPLLCLQDLQREPGGGRDPKDVGSPGATARWGGWNWSPGPGPPPPSDSLYPQPKGGSGRRTHLVSSWLPVAFAETRTVGGAPPARRPPTQAPQAPAGGGATQPPGALWRESWRWGPRR